MKRIKCRDWNGTALGITLRTSMGLHGNNTGGAELRARLRRVVETRISTTFKVRLLWPSLLVRK